MKKLVVLCLSLLILMILVPGCVTVQTPVPVSTTPAGQAPVIGSFSSSPSSGGTQTLVWNVSGANSVSIDNGIGQVDFAGSRVISPVTITTYTLTATNASGTTTNSQIVNNTAYSPEPVAFRVTNVTATSNQSTYEGSCPKTLTFSATITANGPGTITYRWERSDYNWGHMQSMTFTEAGSQSVTLNYDLGETSSGWYRVNVFTPSNIVSNPIIYTITCLNN
ncbi:MAG: hypothetical protein A2Z02_01740 [Chloroflexi bacterium RBG_16_48_7]|nr:MAG: hypothetical protein A2Z02_01740 [Chloroflexi bacterium RBG_16_48_7]